MGIKAKSIFLSTLVAFLLISTFSISLTPQKAEALSGSQFQAGRIMDDSLFFSSNNMGPVEIQNFLNAKVPVCDTWHAPGGGYSPPFTCLKDYRQDTPSKSVDPGLCNGFAPGNKSAAEIIYQVSVSCGVSPKVILVLLQKEQSLITDTWPWPIQYRSATGFGCPDTAPCDAEYYGFFNQVYNAARQYKKYAQNPGNYIHRANAVNYVRYHPNAACGGTNVYINNQATAGLYNYTPYQPNQGALNNLYGTGDGCSAYGNRNFWRMYNDWFGPTTGTPLLKGSGPTVFLVSNGARYAVPSSAMLANYNLWRTGVTPVSDSYLNSLTDGGILSTLFYVPGDPTVYVADSERKFGIPSASACTNWGFNCSTGAKAVSYDIASNLSPAGALQPLNSYQGMIYKMQNGKRHPYLSMSAVTEDGYTPINASLIGSSHNAGNGVGSPIVANNSLVKFGNKQTVYYHINDHYYVIPDGNTYNNWFLGKGVIHDGVSSYSNGPPSVQAVLRSIFRTSGGTTLLLNNGKKIDITSRASDWPAPLISAELDTLATNRPLQATDTSQSTYRTPNGAITVVKDGQRRIFTAMHDFTALGFSLNNVINVNHATMATIPVGPYSIGEGTIFKVNGNLASIYLKGQGDSVYFLTSINQLGQFQLLRSTPTAPANQLSIYDTPRPVSSFVALGGATNAQYVVDATSKAWNFGSAQASQWGVSSPALTNMSSTGYLFSRLTKTNSNLPAFAVYNGTVYYGNGGVKHPIATGSSYSQLGGNASNTFHATKDFLDASPTGSVL